MTKRSFEWSDTKDWLNQSKHGVSFHEAQFAFLDPQRLILQDVTHSTFESRFYCVGLDRSRIGILTVRFTYRDEVIRIFGAGYWRKGKRLYEKANSIYR